MENWRKAGKIAKEALEYGKTLVKTDALLIEVANKIEDKIVELGGQIAFPVNISLNHVAAHYTPAPNEETKFKDEIVKLDVGVHVEGAIGDTALTIDLSGKNQELVQASEDALNQAIKIIKPGITLGKIGKAIEDAITKRGFVPIRNLSGHSMDIYNLHAGLTIPNYDTEDDTKLEEGMIIAIEPFATTGSGMIEEGSNAEIFMLEQVRPLRNMTARKILKEIESFNGLPFCSRVLVKKFNLMQVRIALKEMSNIDMLKLYPPLPEVNKGLVSQAEHTILITKDGCEVLT
ncbi:type II methionyl aminopeptidase [Nanoarchaeota archaeon]